MAEPDSIIALVAQYHVHSISWFIILAALDNESRSIFRTTVAVL